MTIADNMRSLAQEIAGAYEDRVESIAVIRQETADFLNDSHNAHEEMANEIRAGLAKFKADLVATGSERKASDQAEIKEREAYIKNLLDDFERAHREMGNQIRAALAKFKADLVAAGSERKASDQAEIKEREDYIKNLLDDFERAHQEMGNEIRAELARFKADLVATGSERKAYIKNLLDDFERVHQEMAENMRAELAKLKPELEAGERERKWAISSMLEEFRKEVGETSAAWKELLAHMQSLRGQLTITGAAGVEAAVEVKPIEEAIEEPVEEAEEEELEEEEKTALKDQILDVLGDNPDGLRMTDIADDLGIENWRSLIPVIGELLDEDKIIKKDSTYYIT